MLFCPSALSVRFAGETASTDQHYLLYGENLPVVFLTDWSEVDLLHLQV